jgi:hypothetical protein
MRFISVNSSESTGRLAGKLGKCTAFRALDDEPWNTQSVRGISTNA